MDCASKALQRIKKVRKFFQPSMKLLEKERLGAKVWKKYDEAKTPFQRILLSDHIDKGKKEALTVEYQSLDPVGLMAEMKVLQDELWDKAWKKDTQAKSRLIVEDCDVNVRSNTEIDPPLTVSRYYRSSKKVDLRSAPRTYRTRPDPFENTWDEIRLRLELAPEVNAVEIIGWLTGKYPNQITVKHTRTLQRRIKQWRQGQVSQELKMREIMINTTAPVPIYTAPL